MSDDIQKIPTDELLTDLKESIDDISACQQALHVGVIEYSGGSVQQRLEINKTIVLKIKTELARRWSADPQA